MFSLRPTSRDDELRVKPEHFEREGDFVDHALAGRLFRIPQLKIFARPIAAVPVFVVDVFALLERAAQHLFHNKAVFEGFLLPSDANTDVTRTVDVAVRVGGTPPSAVVAAFLRAVTGSVIKIPFGSISHAEASPWRDLAAKLTGKGWNFRHRAATGTRERAVPLVRAALSPFERFLANDAVQNFAHAQLSLILSRLSLLALVGWRNTPLGCGK
jgi:hypothetical protein